jgi:O-antigen/teichoic acid export membrane protein
VSSPVVERKGSRLRRALSAAAARFPERFLRDLSLQTGGNYLSTALLLARGLLLARLLGPAGLGVYATVGIVIAYAAYADLGMGRVPAREIPLALGAGQNRKAEEWRWYGLVSSTGCALLAAGGLAMYVAIRWSSLQPDMRFGLLTACIVLVTSALTTEQQVILRAQQRFGRVTALLVLTAAVSLVAGVVGAVLADVRGVFVGQVVAFACAAGASLVWGGLPRPMPIRAGFLWRLLKAGIPFAVINLVQYNLINIDQVMTVALLGGDALGTYMPVLYAGTAVALFPNALVFATGSRLIYRFGEVSRMEAIAGLTWRPVKGMSVVMPVLCALAWILGPWGIELFLPAYSSAIGPLRIYVVGMFFLGLNAGTGSVLFAINKHMYDIPVVIGCIALNVGLDIAFIKWWHLGLSGIALGSAFTYAAYWVAHTLLVHHYFSHQIRYSLFHLLASGWPGLALALADLAAWATGDFSSPISLFWTLVLALSVAVFFVRLRRAGGWAFTRHE